MKRNRKDWGDVMEQFIRKFSISIMSLIFSFAIFGTVTYAWFSLAKTNVLDNLTINITTGNHLEISLDGVDYYKKLPARLVQEAIGKQLSLKDVTSYDGINFMGGPLKEEEVRPNIDYFSLTFWFRTTAQDKRDVYLVDNVSNDIDFGDEADGTYVVSRGIKWRSDNTFQNGPNPLTDTVYPGQRGMFKGADAIRISFVEEKDKANPYDVRSEDKLIHFIFDPSGDQERGFGKSYGAFAYFKAKRKEDIKIPEVIPDAQYDLTEFSEANPYIPLNSKSRVTKLIDTVDKSPEGKIYYRGKLTVNIWLEGWDADCFSSIYRDTIKVQLRFKAGRSINTSE